MQLCRLTSLKCCEREYGDCENCRVPNSFGFFWTLKGAKMVCEQRFILNRARRGQLANIAAEMQQLAERLREINELPSREEYERKKRG